MERSEKIDVLGKLPSFCGISHFCGFLLQKCQMLVVPRFLLARFLICFELEFRTGFLQFVGSTLVAFKEVDFV